MDGRPHVGSSGWLDFFHRGPQELTMFLQFDSRLCVSFRIILNDNVCSKRTLSTYSATLCVSAVFAVARGPSVPLSITLACCIQTAGSIANILSRPGSPVILVFAPQRRYPNSREPLQRVGNIWYFRLKSTFVSETVRDRPVVDTERYRRRIDQFLKSNIW